MHFLVFFFQVHGSVCVSVCTILLLQKVQYVRPATESRVFWIHSSHVLCILSHVRNCVILCISNICTIHLHELEDQLKLSSVITLKVYQMIGVVFASDKNWLW